MAGCGSQSQSQSPSPCGACKFLRRKCAPECVFGPYFRTEQGPARFAAIHKVFGASNVSKLLHHIPVQHRSEAVVTIAYEAQARIRNPVYGCVAHIFALQHQVAYLQAQLMEMKAQIASSNLEVNPWQGGVINTHNPYNNMQTPVIFQNYHSSSTGVSQVAVNNSNNNVVISNDDSSCFMNPISPQSSLESIDQQQQQQSIIGEEGMSMVMAMQELGAVIHTKAEGLIGQRSHTDMDMHMGELQELAFRMMRT